MPEVLAVVEALEVVGVLAGAAAAMGMSTTASAEAQWTCREQTSVAAAGNFGYVGLAASD